MVFWYTEGSMQLFVPRLKSGSDIRSLPLTPALGFVLSRIDGRSNLRDLADLTGMGFEALEKAVRELDTMGVLEWVTDRPPWAPPAAAMPEDGVDLPLDRRRRVDELYLILDWMTHYEALSVPPNADRNAVRKSYFDLSKEFHPDTLFRRQLGGYKAKMEAIFKRVTDAYDVLSKPTAREAYNQTLIREGRLTAAEANAPFVAPETRPSDPAMSDTAAESSDPPPRSPPRVSNPAAPRTPYTTPQHVAGEGTHQSSPAPRQLPPQAAAAVQVPAVQAAPPPTVQTREPSKLPSAPAAAPTRMGSVMPPRGMTTERQRRSQLPPSVLRNLATSLKAASQHTGGLDSLRKHIREAQVYLKSHEYEKALELLRLAIAIDPLNGDVKQLHTEASTKLFAKNADQLMARAHKADADGNWKESAKDWVIVAEGKRNNSEAWRNAARAIFKAGGDLKEAQRCAMSATQLAPTDVRAFVLLGEICLAAKLDLNAKRALLRVKEIDPDNADAERLLKKIKS